MNPTTALTLPPKQLNWLIATILSLYPLLGMGVDLISPSLPAISDTLAISHAVSKNLIAIYMLGYAIGNFMIGFLSDILGRRKPIIGGLFSFMIVSLIPIFFVNEHILLAARFLQGFSIAGLGVIGRSIFSDLLPQKKLMHTMVLINAMWAIGPIFGPVIGSYLQYYYGWQFCFYFFSFYSCIGLLIVFFILPETHFNYQALNFKLIKNNFITITSNQFFMGSIILMGILYSLLIVFNTLGTFLIQDRLGYTSIYFGHLAFFMGLTFLLGTFICNRLFKFYTQEKILSLGISLLSLIAFIAFIAAYIHDKNINIIIASTLLMFLGCGILYPTGQSQSIVIFRHLAGSASAIMSLVNILITSLTAFLTSFITATSAIPLTLAYLILMLFSILSYWLLMHPKQSQA